MTAEAETVDTSIVNFVDVDQLKSDTVINVADLSTDMQRHTSMYVHYATQAVRARRQHERCKVAFEIVEARLDGVWRTSLKEENPKTTEGQIRAAVVTDPIWKNMSARVIAANEQFRLAEVAERSFDSRKDMLLQLARDAAREGAGQLRVTATADSRQRLLDSMKANETAS